MFDEMEDWKELLTAEFREWLDSIEEEPLPDENENSETDMLAFYGELTALRQELGIQTRCTRKNSQEMLETLTGLKDSLTKSSFELEVALRDVKSQIPQIRMQAEESLLMEILRLWEGLSENVQQFKKQRLRGLFASKTDAAMLQNEQRKQELLLKKTDDVLRRFDVMPVAKIGDAFNAAEMRALASSKNSDVSPGCVSKIYVQGFRRKEKLLSTAEVEVRSL